LGADSRARIGYWDADALENAFAYVGSDLSVSAWLARAFKLFTDLPGAAATREILNIDAGAQDRDTDIADNVENAETVKIDDKGVEKKRRPSRDIHPSALAWAALVVRRFAELLHAIPREGKPAELRNELMRLLDRLGFRDQVAEPARRATEDEELPQTMLNFNALEALRRGFVAAIKAIEIAGGGPASIRLSTFLQEVRRSLASQSQLFGAPDRSGLRVLEATDVRGLRFRAVFMAGLIEGGFPLSASRDWIYPHEERDRLREYGLTLEDISPITLLKE
jgi:superfamily I DNA/RNA helicase